MYQMGAPTLTGDSLRLGILAGQRTIVFVETSAQSTHVLYCLYCCIFIVGMVCCITEKKKSAVVVNHSGNNQDR